jgi:protein-S-isoprenylcysteine O-methyltransferase Ste14
MAKLLHLALVLAIAAGAMRRHFGLSSLILYEWTRRTVVDRNFYVGLAGEAPPALCDAGPYRYVRRPFYFSYMVAFGAVRRTMRAIKCEWGCFRLESPARSAFSAPTMRPCLSAFGVLVHLTMRHLAFG